MDLYAYSQIPVYSEEIKEILQHIPRLRGIRKMSEEKEQHDEKCYQLDRFNHYCGQDGVYMIHARIGGTSDTSNWVSYGGPDNIATQPWFLEKVDDNWDPTYCDIYITTNYQQEPNPVDDPADKKKVFVGNIRYTEESLKRYKEDLLSAGFTKEQVRALYYFVMNPLINCGDDDE